MGKKERTVPMNITVPASLKQELKKHPETSWSRIAVMAFQRHLEAEKLLARFAELGLSDHEVLKRALSVQHPTETMKMKGRKLRDVRKELEKIYKTMDAKKLKISEKEILDEIAAVRREKRETRLRQRKIATF